MLHLLGMAAGEISAEQSVSLYHRVRTLILDREGCFSCDMWHGRFCQNTFCCQLPTLYMYQ